ncbi:unnamed protein product [Blepharisma stoltei]|uniref:tRNA-uridine aminocarboxypropyltransferase n=1 Tax=Blepharisma stoltei TaxID=1481888 RepID=A0AAU9IVY4_9CILI|nr:unnamed protein product [Blepharisma stoltei]
MEHLGNDYYVRQYIDSVEAKKAERWCPNCWVLHEYCICKKLTPLENIPNIELKVFMHYKEYKKTSNTGCIIKKMLPNNTGLYIHGLDDDKNRLLEEMKDGVNSCVLYPGEKSISFDEWKNSLDMDLPIKAVLLDSTWAQGKKLNKVIPKMIPRVQLTAPKPSLIMSKRQSNNTNLCTLECAALFLQLLGHNVESAMKEAFMLKDKASLRQKNKCVLLSQLEQDDHYEK